MGDVTQILAAMQVGDSHSSEELIPLVYNELRRLAASRMAHESPENTLQPTALVHEAFLRLVGSEAGQSWNSRGHFFAAAAEAMRRILIEAARKKRSLKRGEGFERVELDIADGATLEINAELLDLDAALLNFAQVEPRAAELVKLRFFAGLTIEEAAAALQISPRTAKREWAYARVWLRREMDEHAQPS